MGEQYTNWLSKAQPSEHAQSTAHAFADWVFQERTHFQGNGQQNHVKRHSLMRLGEIGLARSNYFLCLTEGSEMFLLRPILAP
jgi:hypothetical protein